MNSCKCLTLFVLLCLFSCGEQVGKPAVVPKDQMKGSMEKANRYMLNEEETDIGNYVRRHGLEMERTGTGLRYQVIMRGTGNKIGKGQKVSLEYRLDNLQGDLIYSSENEGVKSFVVGEGTVESGLDEAMTYLHYGDVAKIIIPFHLGYGMRGDDNRITEYMTLVYTVKITENQ